MRVVTVTAKRSFAYCGQPVTAGQVLQMRAVDAASMARSGHVSLASVAHRAHRAEAQAESVPSELEAPKKRRYRRRDLQAESAT